MRTTITILFVAAAGVPAAADPAEQASADDTAWTVGVEPRFGVTIPTSKLSTMVVGGLEGDYALPVANHQLILALDLALTQPSYDGTVSDPRIAGGMTTYKIHQTEWVVGLVASYRFASASHALVPHIGAGPLLHMLKTNETEGAAPGENTAQQTKLGIEVVGGIDYKAGPGLIAIDVRLLYSGLDTPIAGSTNAGNLALALGYRLVF